MYLAAPVPRPLAGRVRAVAGYDETTAVPLLRREVPTGSCTLIVGFGDALDVDGRSVTAFLAGTADRPALTGATGRQRGVQVDLTPLGAYRLLGVPMDLLAGRAVALDDLDPGGDLARLAGRLADATCWSTRFTLVTDVLTARDREPRARPDPEVVHAWRRMAERRGRVPVSELAGEVGWSRRRLLDRFRGQVGLAPTPYGRVLRFRHAAELLVPGRGPARMPAATTIADVAARAGYADQAHLVREFHALAGLTPGRYVAGWRPDVQATDATGS